MFNLRETRRRKEKKKKKKSPKNYTNQKITIEISNLTFCCPNLCSSSLEFLISCHLLVSWKRETWNPQSRGDRIERSNQNWKEASFYMKSSKYSILDMRTWTKVKKTHHKVIESNIHIFICVCVCKSMNRKHTFFYLKPMEE